MAVRERATMRVTLAASGALAATVVPVFLTGALSEPMGDELGFGPAGAGLAVTGFFVAAGLAAVPMAKLGQRLGVRAAMRLGVTVSEIGCVAIAGLARTWWHLAVSLVTVGAVVGLVDTAAAGAFAATIRRRRQGLAFGVKEASVPIASMVAGVSVPLAAAWLGWRAAFVAVAALLPLAWLAVPSLRLAAAPADARAEEPGARAAVSASRQPGQGSVRLLAFGIAAGAGAANAAATLLVPTTTSAGLAASSAGLLLAAASVASVIVRVAAGWTADRGGFAPSVLVAWALALGAVGTAVLAATARPVAMTLGAMIALGAGWGWTGLAFLAAVRMMPEAPARAAGTVLTGLAIGGAVGPSAFAAVGGRAGTSAAWSLAAAAFLLGAATTLAAHRR